MSRTIELARLAMTLQMSRRALDDIDGQVRLLSDAKLRLRVLGLRLAVQDCEAAVQAELGASEALDAADSGHGSAVAGRMVYPVGQEG